jgi:ABC-type bacteriocin/lantibiotic exporter with double-glycine peptidase domain
MQESDQPSSLGDLAKAARRLGFDLVPAKLTMVELANLGVPAVILFEEMDVGRGRFHLLVALSSSHVHLVNGQFMVRGEIMTIDRFRRSWTGFALVPRQDPGWSRRILVVMTAAFLAGALVWISGRKLKEAI